MQRNAIYAGFNLNPIKASDLGLGFGSKKSAGKRTLGIRDKQILYQRAKGRCESCHKKIEFSEMQTGHKTAAAKGGKATLRNSVCICYRCNKLQGTDSWITFMRKQGKSNTRSVTSSKKRHIKRKLKHSNSVWGNFNSGLVPQSKHTNKNNPWGF